MPGGVLFVDLHGYDPQRRIEPADALDGLLRALGVAADHIPVDIQDRAHQARRIARCCGWLPLALRIVAAQLAEDPHRPLAAVAGDLEDERSRLGELAIEERAVRPAFDLSYRNLPEELAASFRLLTLNPGPDISTTATAALAGAAVRTTRPTLEGLARAHLLEPGPCMGGGAAQSGPPVRHRTAQGRGR